MTAGELALSLVGGLLLLVGLSLVVMYNRFVRQRTLVEESWGQIDVELTRRHELVPNTRVATFSSNLVASAFGFERRDFFELTDPAARIALAVDL